MNDLKLTPSKTEISNVIRYTWDCNGQESNGVFDVELFDNTIRTILQAYGDTTDRRFQLFVGECSVEGSVYFTIDRILDGIKPVYKANVTVSGIFKAE